jgi:stage II sporulation protein D
LRLFQLRRDTGAALAAAVAVAVGLAMACRSVPRRAQAIGAGEMSVEDYVAAPAVRVAIATGVARVVLTADDGSVVVWPTRDGRRHPVPAPAASFRVAPDAPGGVRLVDTGEQAATMLVVPASKADTLRLDGVPYRGLLEVRADDAGVTVVNVVNIEDYLRGVVPNELSPLAFPQIEALKAQAVAARTYALKNKDHFKDKGYDLCATPSCQVYKGKSSEHPVSDRAVEETRGMVETFSGAPIEAFYTSTCGGHTEDAANIFEDEAAPYLRGVVCAPEQSAWSLLRSTAATRTLGNEGDLNRNAALLVAAGVVDAKPDFAAYLEGQASDNELKGWTSRLLNVARRKGCDTTASSPLARRGAFFRYLVGAACWDERAKRLLSPGDPEFLLRVEDQVDLLGPEEGLAAALLMQEGILTPYADNTLRAGRAVTRAGAVGLLAGVLEKLGTPVLVTGEFQGSEGDQVRVSIDGRRQALALDPQARLFRSLDGARSAASELSLVVGDRVSLVADQGRILFFEADQSRLGDAADRTSRFFRWELRLTPAEVAKVITRYGTVGAVKDLVPRRIGNSGRVVDLAVVGADRELVLKGMSIRFALGLKENLFVIDRELGDQGQVAQFIFTGKGWGHGVGLCQVGAYGMARAGTPYARILSHYYPGTSLEKVY